MATLLDLASPGGPLAKLDPGLEPRDQEWRVIYAAGRFRDWVQNDLPKLTSQWEIETTPLEQFVALAEIFASGETLTYGERFKPLHPREEGIWELKTPDLRIFGWFPQKDHFVAVVADTAERVKTHGLYHGYLGEVKRFRTALNLDDPKYMTGDDPHAVISNYDLT
jgi:hypothetical protein